MPIRAPRKGGDPFRTEAGKEAYRALLKDGPIARIFVEERLRLAPAKGAARYRARDPTIFDQTYFAHALNVSITAGLLFEVATASAPGGAATARELRIVLAAGSIHDFNKLQPTEGGAGLSRALAVEETEIRRIVGEYVDEKEFQDVLFLAISVEEGTGKDASRYSPSMPARRSTLAVWCLQLADQLAGTHADPNDPERYARIVTEFRARWPAVPEIRVQPLAILPQPALAREARQAVLDWLRDQERCTLLHESERYVTWVGPRPTSDDYSAIGQGLVARIRPTPADAFDKAGVSHHGFSTTWTESIEPTPEVVDAWIEHFGGTLVFWQGDWGAAHFHAIASALPGVFVYDKPTKDRPKGRVRVELGDSDESASTERRRIRERAKIVIAHAVLQKVRDNKTFPKNPALRVDPASLDGVMGSTVPAILWAIAEKDTPLAYESVIEQISKILLAERPARPDPIEGIVAALLGGGDVPDSGPTGEACIYCGAASTRPVEDALVFGIKPTSWAPRKKGVQKETVRGVLCDRCVVENQLRDRLARETQAVRGEAGYLTAHVHAADLICDINWEALAALLDSSSPQGEARLILFPKGSKASSSAAREGQTVPLRGHTSIPIPKPKGAGKVSDTLAYLWRLRDCLTFVKKTGFKLHVSPLFLMPAQERAQFRWTNGPGWMSDLGLAEVHVDELLEVSKVVDALVKAGNATGGSQGHRSFISRLVRDPLAVYDVADASRGPAASDSFVTVLEEKYVPSDEKASLTSAALAFVKFNAKGEWSNNTWTWAPREFLELRERYAKEAESRSLIVGDLLASAKRKWEGAPADHVEAFVDAMGDYLARFRDGQTPIGPDRRVLINAVSYLCKKNYRVVYPKEVTTQ